MKLKEIRKERKLSVPALSKLSGVPIRTIEDLEKRDDGRISTLMKLADALNVSLDELCYTERHLKQSEKEQVSNSDTKN